MMSKVRFGSGISRIRNTVLCETLESTFNRGIFCFYFDFIFVLHTTLLLLLSPIPPPPTPPQDTTVLEAAGIEPSAVATSALSVRQTL